MSRAFTREDDSDNAIADIGERPVSHAPQSGDAEAASTRSTPRSRRCARNWRKAEAEADRERIALMSRDLRYWNARRESAEVSVPDPDSDVVRFGMTRHHRGRGRQEGAAGRSSARTRPTPRKATISHVSPMALALFGKKVGEIAVVNGKEWEIVKLGRREQLEHPLDLAATIGSM